MLLLRAGEAWHDPRYRWFLSLKQTVGGGIEATTANMTM
jgi:hypothetical protein